MSNDRIFMKCKGCKEEIAIIKHYPYGGNINDGYTSLKGFEEWLYKHYTECHPNYTDLFLEGNPGFELVTESLVQDNKGE